MKSKSYLMTYHLCCKRVLCKTREQLDEEIKPRVQSQKDNLIKVNDS